MGVRQLEEFLGQGDQKGFWVFSYANLGGAFFGAFAANSLLESSPPVLKVLGIVAGVLLGVLVTWKLKGYPIYRWILSHLIFLLRRHLKVGLGNSVVDADSFYRSRTVRQEPFMLIADQDGKVVPVLVHRGTGKGSPADLLDGLFIPPGVERSVRVPKTAESYPEKRGQPTNPAGSQSTSTSSRLLAGREQGSNITSSINRPLDPSDYDDWEL